jgi:hypothetical protein
MSSIPLEMKASICIRSCNKVCLLVVVVEFPDLLGQSLTDLLQDGQLFRYLAAVSYLENLELEQKFNLTSILHLHLVHSLIVFGVLFVRHVQLTIELIFGVSAFEIEIRIYSPTQIVNHFALLQLCSLQIVGY